MRKEEQIARAAASEFIKNPPPSAEEAGEMRLRRAKEKDSQRAEMVEQYKKEFEDFKSGK
ncbi:MAG: hypothetical protein Q8P49_00410 [Candidatus Liptonbacteria bacterium]|nr:hypothetical protein [Candidatus Liptonbacteria bacterium]